MECSPLNKRIVLLFFFFFSLNSQAQINKSYQDTPLKQVLQELSEFSNIIFSFSDEIVEDKIVKLEIVNATLDEVLLMLTQQTALNFQKIAKNQVIINRIFHTMDICGHIRDQDTQEAIPYATIRIANKNKGTIADEYGFFTLRNIDKSATLVIQQLGYAEQTFTAVALPQSDCVEIRLATESIALQEVMIKEYITTGMDRNTDGSIRISNERLGILPGLIAPDIFQSVQLIPGISSPDETVTGLQIRGGSSDQNVLLWDDIPLYNNGHFFGSFSAINPYIVKDAILYKGGADPKYGNRISGVLDIASDTEIPKRFTTNIGINGISGDLVIKTPVTKKIGLILSGRRSYTDLLKTGTFTENANKIFQNAGFVAIPVTAQNERSKSDFLFYDTTAKIIIDVSDHDKVMASGLFTRDNFSYEYADDTYSGFDDIDTENTGGSLSWKGSKKEFQHTLKAYFSDYSLTHRYSDEVGPQADFFDQIPEDELENFKLRYFKENTIRDVGIEANVAYTFQTYHRLNLGYLNAKTDVRYNRAALSGLNPVEFTLDIRNRINALYGSYTYTAANTGFITLGARGSHYSTTEKIYVEPRILMEYPITDFLRAKATGEYRYQPLSELQNFESNFNAAQLNSRFTNTFWIQSQGQIPILESQQVSAGFLISSTGWILDIDGYYKKIKGLNSFSNGFTINEDEFTTGESTITGIDIFLKKRFNNYRLWLGYTFNDTNLSFSSLQNSSFPGNNDITHHFRISNTLTLNSFEFSLGWLWRTGSPFTDFNAIAQEGINGSRFPNYHRLDASALYRFNFNTKGNWKGFLGISVQNIYNTKTPIIANYITQNDTDEIEFSNSLGVLPNMTFRMNF